MRNGVHSGNIKAEHQCSQSHGTRETGLFECTVLGNQLCKRFDLLTERIDCLGPVLLHHSHRRLEDIQQLLHTRRLKRNLTKLLAPEMKEGQRDRKITEADYHHAPKQSIVTKLDDSNISDFYLLTSNLSLLKPLSEASLSEDSLAFQTNLFSKRLYF